jgi:hypothetical protein
MRINSKIINVFGYLLICSVIIIGLMTITGVGCGGGETDKASDNNLNPAIQTGFLSLSLTDSPTMEAYKEVWVTIKEVRVQLAEEGVVEDDTDTSDWKVVASTPGTYNLLSLVGGVMEQLGITELETGHYSQMRLYLGSDPVQPDDNPSKHPYANYVVEDSGATYQLTIPSGYQTGIKLVKGFDIEAGVTKELVLDFDVSKSIVTAGKSGKIILKPTIKVIDVINRAIVKGVIYKPIYNTEDGSTTNTPLPGAHVTAQVYYDPVNYPNIEDPKDRIIIAGGTESDANGEYYLILDPGKYNIVTYSDGFTPSCFFVDAQYGSTISQDITLYSTNEITNIYGTISLPYKLSEYNEEDIYTTISFRSSGECSGADTQIEVLSVNIPDAGEVEGEFDSSFEVDLPALPEGEYYNIVFSSTGFNTRESSSEIIPVIIE